ncbi:MAG: hypothetical protein R3C03_20710 [Pirellulaceae bacterium]
MNLHSCLNRCLGQIRSRFNFASLLIICVFASASPLFGQNVNLTLTSANGDVVRLSQHLRSIKQLREFNLTFRKKTDGLFKSPDSEATDDEIRLRKNAAVIDLIYLTMETVGHPDYAQNNQLNLIRNQAASVLKRSMKRLVNESDHEEGQGNTRFGESSQSGERLGTALYAANRKSFLSVMNGVGGPLHDLGDLPGSFAPPFGDQELINLIQSTISPDQWRVNGGDASIGYYENALALIVLASQETQDEICDLLMMLR